MASTPASRQYALITGNYWAFTLTDGALRMLVVLHFHQLGYSPLQIALLFVFYEIFGVVTNLVGGWLGARIGLNRTMNIGLGLQIGALVMLAVPIGWLTIPWVMAAQAVSGIAKDLNKMSAKSSVKLLVSERRSGELLVSERRSGELLVSERGSGELLVSERGSDKLLLPEHGAPRAAARTGHVETTLYRWVAALTGSKNALKGAGFFLGGALLTALGFRGAVLAMAAALALVWIASLLMLRRDLGKSQAKPKFRQILSKSRAINVLSAARLFLFGARDVWFVVALPVFLATSLGWDHWRIGGFLAAWMVGYGIVQAGAPRFSGGRSERPPGRLQAFAWAAALALVPAGIAAMLPAAAPGQVLVIGLGVFGVVFAINSSLHSYLVVSFARDDAVSLDVGFYYMANAVGRLLGTVLSGWVYQAAGLAACLWISAAFVAVAAVVTLALPERSAAVA
ncbi:MAG: MFS transporter [Pseudomonadota bacterium]|nr:MFS transporter [Pseudomonadota bacterium]